MDDLEPTPDESLDRLAGEWRIFQLKRGHRFSTDDMVCAWRAALSRPDARSLLDLGCGIGSVGLLALWKLGDPAVRLTGIEAQETSANLARRTVRRNGLSAEILDGDLRESSALIGAAQFDLITGSPPYLPVGTGRLSPVDQRAGARIELRGSVFDYCAAAARHLAPGGRFAFVMAAADPRTEAAPIAAGLEVVERWDYRFRADRAPHIATLVCARAGEGGPRATGELVIRGPNGEWTAEYLGLRAQMGGPPLRS
jgi:tRNA1(Val) A37 N6-methylase TrmN6